ncbi:MAG: hypothetical protein AAFR16_13915 [Pseudomonadota bacterium]
MTKTTTTHAARGAAGWGLAGLAAAFGLATLSLVAPGSERPQRPAGAEPARAPVAAVARRALAADAEKTAAARRLPTSARFHDVERDPWRRVSMGGFRLSPQAQHALATADERALLAVAATLLAARDDQARLATGDAGPADPARPALLDPLPTPLPWER